MGRGKVATTSNFKATLLMLTVAANMGLPPAMLCAQGRKPKPTPAVAGKSGATSWRVPRAKAIPSTATLGTSPATSPADITIGKEDLKAPANEASQEASHTAAKIVDDAIAQAEKRSSSGSGNDAILGRLTVVILKSMRSETIAYATALSALGELKLDLASIRSVQEIDAWIARFSGFRKASVNLHAALKEVPVVVREELEDMQLPPERTADAVQAVLNLYMWHDRIAEAGNAEKLCDSSITVLHNLKRQWGRWSIIDGRVKFSALVPPKDQASFNAAQSSMSGAVKGILEAQSRIRRAAPPQPTPGQKPKLPKNEFAT